jgi:class 3 adenylate cyclase
MRPETRYARNGDASIAYQVIGDGPIDLLYISGFFSHVDYAWELPSYARFLERLASFARLITMDRRGSGLSDRLVGNQPPPLETLVDDIGRVLEAVGSERAALFGLFDGTLLTTMFSAVRPDRVSALVLYCASACGRKQPDYPFAWTEEEWETWLASIRDGWGTAEWIEEHCQWTYPEVIDSPEFPKWKLAYRMAASPSSAEALMRIYSRTDIRDILSSVRVPTLLLHKTDEQSESIEGARYIADRIPDARLIEVPGRNTPPWSENPELILEPIQEFLTGVKSTRESDRMLATILFTDIVGSTETAVRLGDRKWRELLAAHHETVRRLLERHLGREIDTAGDGFLATFEGPAAAVRCADAIVGEVRSLGIEVRTGVHTGECERTDQGIGGIAVHIGARVAARSRPSEVLVTSTVKELVVGSGLHFVDRGEFELKGVPDRWHLYALAA